MASAHQLLIEALIHVCVNAPQKTERSFLLFLEAIQKEMNDLLKYKCTLLGNKTTLQADYERWLEGFFAETHQIVDTSRSQGIREDNCLNLLVCYLSPTWLRKVFQLLIQFLSPYFTTLELLNQFLSKLFNQESAMGHSYTPLMVAAHSDNPEKVDLLLTDTMAKVNKQNRKGYNPLAVACRMRNKKAVKVLLAKGAKNCEKISEGTCQGFDCLLIAVDIGEVENVQALLKAEKAGINVNEDYWIRTSPESKREKVFPLLHAVRKDNYLVVKILLCYNAVIEPSKGYYKYLLSRVRENIDQRVYLLLMHRQVLDYLVEIHCHYFASGLETNWKTEKNLEYIKHIKHFLVFLNQIVDVGDKQSIIDLIDEHLKLAGLATAYIKRIKKFKQLLLEKKIPEHMIADVLEICNLRYRTFCQHPPADPITQKWHAVIVKDLDFVKPNAAVLGQYFPTERQAGVEEKKEALGVILEEGGPEEKKLVPW